MLLSSQIEMIESAKYSFSLLGKAFEKQAKTMGDQGKKHVEVLRFMIFWITTTITKKSNWWQFSKRQQWNWERIEWDWKIEVKQVNIQWVNIHNILRSL